MLTYQVLLGNLTNIILKKVKSNIKWFSHMEKFSGASKTYT